MTEWRVPEIVRQRQGFGEIFIQRQNACQRARDLRDFERVGQSRAVIVAFVVYEDLRLVLEAAKGGRMDNAVPVALIAGSRGALLLRPVPAPARFGTRGKGRARWRDELRAKEAPGRMEEMG